MRILQIIATLNPAHGGPIDGALRLGACWEKSGHQVEYLTLDGSDASYLSDIGCTVHAMGGFSDATIIEGPKSLRKRYGYAPAADKWLKSNINNFDYFIVHALWNYTTVISRKNLVKSKKPYFVFPHGCLDPWFKKAYPIKSLIKYAIWPLNEGILINNASAALFTTKEEMILAENCYHPYRLNGEVVGFGCSTPPNYDEKYESAFRRTLPLLGNKKYLLFLSRIHRKKGCDLLIKAFIGIANEYPDIDLVMAGPDQEGWQSELQKIIDDAKLSGRVHWTGMIEGNVKWGAYFGSEAFVLTSHSENFGIVVAEALACSKPVLITNKVNLWREVLELGAGLVENDTLDGASTLLETYLQMDEASVSNMRTNARLCFERNFRMQAAADNIINVMLKYGSPK